MRTNVLKKLLSIVTTASLLVNSLYTPYYALAQEATFEPTPAPTEESTSSPEPSIEASSNPTTEPSPNEEATAIPEVTLESTPTTESTTSIPEQTQPETQGSTDENSQSQAPPGESPSLNPTPTITPIQSEENETLVAEIIETSLFSETLEENSWFKVITDKLDYAPTEAAVITGSGFDPNKAYQLTVSSTDNPATSTTVDVTTDSNGEFTYTYQLDGIYRPNYSVEVKEGETVVASTTFTDSPISGTTVDSAGANDEPGQKDLTKMSVDYSGLPTNINVTWNWDEINGSGNNSYDACSLYDTDSDGLANYSICVTLKGSPLAQTGVSPRIYSCDDSRSDRCGNSALIASPYITSCSVSQTGTDPFATGDVYPTDTTANCNIKMSEVGGTSSALLDVCSYPSQQPNSDPSDCIVFKDNSGKIEVVKDLLPSNDPGKFNLQIDGATQATDQGDGGTTGEKVVTAGNHTVGEIAGTGTSLSNYSSAIVCKDLNGSGSTIASGSNAGPLQVAVAEGDDIVCTITNTLQNGTLTVQKTTIPADDSTVFSINATGSGTITGGGAGSISDASDQVYTVTAGTYSVAETVPDGWSKTGDTCQDVVIAAGQDATCTITNTKKGHIVVDKVTDPSGDPQSFSFDASGENYGDFSLTDVAAPNDQELVPGTYGISETVPAGWDQTSATCSDDSDPSNISLQAGETVTCTFTNQKDANIVVVKETIPDGNQTSFEFDSDYSDNFFLSDGGSNDSGDLNPGTYGVSEIVPLLGWDLTNTSCVSSLQDTEVANTLDLDAGETITCTFTNTQRGSISGYKYDDLNGDGINDGDWTPVTGWVIELWQGGDTKVDETSTDGNGFYSFTNLVYGAYSLIEQMLTGWTNVSSDTLGVTLEAGEEDTGNNFVNTQYGSITVVKQTDPDGSQENFEFDTSYSTNFFLTDGQQNDSGDLLPGTYSVAELPEGGWDLTGATCDDESDPSSISLQSGEDVICTFTNTERGNIVVVKYNDHNGNGAKDDGDEVLDGWEIHLVGQDVDAYQFTGNGDPAVAGQVTFRDVVPGEYTLSEQIEEGWDQTNIACGEEVGIDADNDHPVSLEAGQDLTCYIGNQGQGTITVNKNLDTDGVDGADVFGYTDMYWELDSADHAMGSTVQVAAGSYGISEVQLSNYHFTNLICKDQEVGNQNTTVDVAPGEDVVCTYTNTRDTGSIIIHKIIDADGNLDTLGDQTDGVEWEFDVEGQDEDTSNPDSQLTDGDGLTTFGQLKTGNYSVGETVLAGYDLIYASCDTGSQDGDIVYSVEVGAGEPVNCTFINSPNGTLHGFKWDDVNGDGVFNEIGSFLPGWTINLYQVYGEGESLVDTFITDDDDHYGWYWFEHLFPGNYKICEEGQLGWSQSYPNDNDGCHLVTIPDDNSGDFAEVENAVGGPTYNFGNQGQGEVTVTKYDDFNGDGEFNNEEDVLSGWTINLEGKDSLITNENGEVDFGNVPAGSHELSENLQEGWYQSNIQCFYGDNEAGQVEDNEYYVDVTPGAEVSCYIGNFLLSAIGDFIWQDNNGDGVQDPGEPGIAGITANLYKDDGDGVFEPGSDDVFIGTDSTDGTGTYLFEGLVLGDYWVDVDESTVPVGYFGTTVDPYLVLDLDPGENFALADFGYVPPQPELLIEKANDKNNASKGDTVTYTLKVTNTGNVSIFNIDIIDILPGGFSYVLGSTSGATTSDPDITGSKLTWSDIQSLEPDESLTITYKALISSDLSDGTYINFATCKGDIRSQESEQECNEDDSSVTLGSGPSFGGNLVGQVLGASTELPATGSPTGFLAIALGLLTAGFILKKYAKK